ncbi:hypothetical protein [Leifsonia sp. LS1]|uniref:hypothetical protein n=1 Tax=Leifsonia sp. LS1 TaxID=2828483 RepID=UPI001CFDCB05|nr:hypothetical protein [Leifsonia sp. LS1]
MLIGSARVFTNAQAHRAKVATLFEKSGLVGESHNGQIPDQLRVFGQINWELTSELSFLSARGRFAFDWTTVSSIWPVSHRSGRFR